MPTITVGPARAFYESYVPRQCYGHNNRPQQPKTNLIKFSVNLLRSQWSDMKSLHAGDFNVVRKPFERLDGFDSTATTEFNSCIDFLNMDDLPTKGFWYTWSNKRGGDGDNKSRLDRAMVNTGWMDDFLEFEVCVEATGISDH
ncbi:hypothetical protein Vadar_010387 [Vaccinium darrowii]|uniref:Uncharacterized protein n=1 Tax=Vaccinium darrowii TaxID=229202 RepID=A0ACB7WZW0_9ERIC|nr:hypothetical protein Vadar_010387 [Vaccinium darrowii]